VALHPTSAQSVEHRQHYSKMKGREVFKSAGRDMSGAAQEIAEHQRLTADQITCAIPHQANRRIIETLSEDLEIPLARFVINLDRYGNTSAASIPLAPDEARHAGRFHSGGISLRLAFGAGLTYESTLIRW
jgi:3-oxoacyl-[acyl-carrier-protein] synthase-3